MTTLPQHNSGESTRLIVCEKSGAWANRMRRSLPDAGKWIVETRSLNQLAESVRENPTSLVLVELTKSNVQLACPCIDELHRQYPQCVLTTILPAADEETPEVHGGLKWLVRELGVQEVICAPRELPSLSHLWSRHCQLHTPHEQTLHERVFQTLPWAEC